MISDDELEILETYLDGQLPPGESRALEARLAAEPPLAETLQQLRSQRKLRQEFFQAIQPQGEAAGEVADRVLVHARDAAALRRANRRWLAALSTRVFAYASAAAALLVIGLLLGRLARQDAPPATHANGISPQPAATVFNVAITDEAGRVVGVQKFKSLDEAKRFSEDIENWQERQENLRNGQVTLRSAKF